MASSGSGRPNGPPSPALFIVLALLIPALLASFALWLGQEYSRMERDRQGVERTAELNASASAVIAGIRQAESAQRGYVLTRDPRFLSPYEPARRMVAARLDGFGGAPSAEAVRELISAKFAEMDQVLELARAGDWQAAAARISDGEGLALMERIERLMRAEVARDTRTLAAGRERYLQRTTITQRTVWTLIAILSLAVLAGLLLLWKYRRERWQAATDAGEALTRHQTILESSSDAIIILNPSGTIEQINAAGLAMLGYEADDLLRRDVGRILDIADGAGTFHQRIGLVGERLASRQLVDRTMMTSDGTSLPVDIALGVMPLPDGLHIVASVRDISDRKQVERMKDEFVATVSHELRTPLTSVVGSLGLLRAGTAGPLPELAQELVGIAESNTRRLIRLTNDILDLEKLSAGKMEFAFTEVELNELARDVAAEHQVSAAARQVTVRVCPSAEPQVVAGDRQRLMQVAGNLLANAIRHTPENSEVIIEVAALDGRAMMRIVDQGAGVPIEFRDRIFDRFAQARPEQGRGSGLGLAISREIIARHDGSVWHEPAPSGGAIFAFALEKIRISAANADWVLLVSEDEEAISRVEDAAAGGGFEVRVAASLAALEALVAYAHPPFLLLFDMDLPNDRRQQLCARLQALQPSAPWAKALISRELTVTGAVLPLEMEWIRKPIDHAAAARAMRVARDHRGPGRPLILHVDDDPDLAEITAAGIADEGEIVHARDLAQARSALRDRRPDVVLLDLALGDGSGLELLPELVDDAGRPIPVIVHSAQDVAGTVAEQIAAVLVKTRHSLPDLRSTLQRTLASRKECQDDL